MTEDDPAFEDGARVPSVGFDYAAVDGGHVVDDTRQAQMEAVRRTVADLVDGAGSRGVAGGRAFILAFVLGNSPFRTQRELAQFLELSEARASVAVKAMRLRLRENIGG